MASPKESRLVLFSFVLLSITARILVNNGHSNMPASNLHLWRKLGMPTRDPTASVVVGLCSYTRGYELNLSLHASLRRVCSPDATTTKNCAMYMLLLCGDVEPNPGPCKLHMPAPLGGKQRDDHLCGYCDLRVDWSDLAVCCDNCDIWYHRPCHGMTTEEFGNVHDVHWTCFKCNSSNSDNNTFHSFELDSNSYYLHDTSDSPSSVPSPSSFRPSYHSSPVVVSPDTGNNAPRDGIEHDSSHFTDCSQDSVTAGILPPKSNNWRTLVVNADGIIGKVAQFANLVSYTKPDAILMCETKLGSHHHSAEFMPPGYSPPVRRDRASGAGGVLIAIRDCYTAVEVEQPSEIKAEISWTKVSLRNKKSLYLGSYYRTPSGKHSEQLDELEKSIKHIRNLTKNNPGSTIILGGDFNLGDVDWETESIPKNSRERVPGERLISIFNNNRVSQMQREPTRFGRLLDLFVTSKPSLVKTMSTLPGIAYDHDVIVADCDIIPAYTKKAPRKIYIFSKANWDNIRELFGAFARELTTNINQHTVEENWSALKNKIHDLISSHVPSKTTSKRQHLPWMNGELKRKTRRKHRMYKKAKKSKNPKHLERFRQVKKETARDLKRARSQYINNSIKEGLDEGSQKPFWKYIKAQRQDFIGVPPLKHQGKLFSDAKDKAFILLQEFKSVFVSEVLNYVPWMGPSHPPISDLTVHPDGVRKLLNAVKPHKASGPDGIPNRVLKELAGELAPLLAALFNQSLQHGSVPEDWTIRPW